MAGGMNWIDYGGILESSQQIGIGERFIVDKDWVTTYIRNPMLNDVSEKVLFFLQNNPSDSVSGLKLKGKYNTSYQLLPGGALTQQGTNQLDTYSYAFEVLDNNTFNAMIDTHTNLQNTYSSQAGGSFQDLETSLGYASYQNLNFPISIKWAIDGQISRINHVMILV